MGRNYQSPADTAACGYRWENFRWSVLSSWGRHADADMAAAHMRNHGRTLEEHGISTDQIITVQEVQL